MKKSMDSIRIRGAREHNLKNINVDIPRDKLVVITGLSGSGKSSLAFDTLYAEGQRRYVESLSAYARQFLQLMEKPDVDSIDGLSPAISIEQKTTSKNPRSTVGTVTELYDYMRLLFARVGVPHSPATGLPIEAQTISQMVDRVLEMPAKTKLMLLAPIARNRKGEFKKEFQDLLKKGFQRVKVNGETYLLEEVPELKKTLKHTISVIVDRFVMPSLDESSEDYDQQRQEFQTRLADSFETAIQIGQGLAYVENVDSNETITFSAKFSCPESGFTLDEIEPRLFSFNSPQGACTACDGLGVEVVFDPQLVVPNPALSLARGAIAPWFEETTNSKRSSLIQANYYQLLEAVVEHFDESMQTPFAKLPKEVQHTILYGFSDGERYIMCKDQVGGRVRRIFEGVMVNLKRRWHGTESDWVREHLGRYQNEVKCSHCEGYRLKPEALCVKINGLHISQVCEMSIMDAHHWFETLPLTQKQADIANRILKEVKNRLSFLLNVGLDYLTLSRAAGTLSGGESQRIRLASQVGSSLTGVLYVLDEPSIGLHQRDNDRLLETLKHLRDIGNTVVVVEHDEDAIRVADYVIDMGPAAGVNGGEIIAQGSPQDVMNHPDSLTGQYLTGKKFIETPSQRRLGHKGKTLSLFGATENNLKNVDISIPLGTFTCVSGVSGGGKSTLVIETLFKALSRQLNGTKENPGAYSRLEGLEHIDKIIDIDQAPIGRTPRSNPATYVGCFSPIRDWFAGLPEAKMRGYLPGRFSFNVKGGRCEACQGDGVIKIEMHFLPDVYVKCDQCHGKRYNRETLEITYRNKSIADILDMSVDEAVEFFEAHNQVREKLKCLQQVAFGYIKVGQSATTLSGGEAQRIKLAKELSRRSTGRTIYILDEPTTGLHFEDVRKLLEVLHTLVDQGNTVVVIEHNLEVIKTADWIIDMGPEGGVGGGKVIAVGTPEMVAEVKASYTGHYLKPYLTKLAEKKVRA